MSGILLDTNALLWLVSDPDRLGPRARSALEDLTRQLHVSAASAWEIAIKTRIGRLDGSPLLAAWPETLLSMGATELSMDSADGILAGGLVWEHRDPFDRMLVAQSTRRGLTVATSDDRVLEAATVPVLDTRQ